MAGSTKLMTSGGGGVNITPATNIAADVTVQVPSQNCTLATTVDAGNYYGFKNRIINGAMAIDQRNVGASQTFTAGVVAYCIDRWRGFSLGANATGQRVTDGIGGYWYRFTGAASVTGLGFSQRIEASNSYDLAGNTATLSIDLSNSILTTISWSASYATTTDNFTSTTSISSGSFTVTSTMTRYSTQIEIPAAATTGIQITFTVGAQTSGTWTIGKVQLEKGSTATSFDYRPYGTELALCQRYYEISSGLAIWGYNLAGNACGGFTPFAVTKRAAPTMAYVQTPNYSNASGYSIGGITVAGYSSYALASVTSAMAAGNVTPAINSASSEL